MSQNRIVARPYAKAVFELAQKEKAFPAWSQMLALAASCAEDKRVLGLMKNPEFSTAALIALFIDLGKDVYSQEMQNFLQTLGRFKRLQALPEIASLYEEMRSRAERVVNVELISAFPLNDEHQARFMSALKARMNCDITLECITDKSILGGAIIRAGDLIIDGSIRGRLAKLSDAVGIS